MKLSKMKMNLVLIATIVMISFVLLVYDNESLNSLVIDYNDNFVINEVNIGKEENKDDDKKVLGEAKVAFINNVSDNKWTFPVSGNYVITTYYSYSHRAIDIYGYSGYGSNILSANSGTVITASSGCYRGDISCNGNRGNYVVIRHNISNYYTVYMHLASINVGVGDIVESGQVIGTMGNTGQVIPVPNDSNPYGGTHLHFCVFVGEPYKGGYAINPFDLY